MDPDRKSRKDSKLDNLKPESRVSELRDMLLAGASHMECKQWLFAECDGMTTSGDALTRFWKKNCAPIVRERRKLAACKSEVYVKEAGRTDWDAATKELVSQVTFEMLDGQRTDPAIAEKFVKLVLKRDAQDQSNRKIAIMEAKAAKADQASDVTNSDLTEEEKAARIKQIFRMG